MVLADGTVHHVDTGGRGDSGGCHGVGHDAR